MKKRHMLVIGLVILCMGAALVFNRCSGENMTKVTINFGSNQQAALNSKASFLERLKRFFIPEAVAFAPPDWFETHDSIVITVSAPGMDPIEATVSPYTESYTMDVPSGSQRRFTVITYNSSGQRNNGGHAEIDLPSGEVTVQVRMLPMATVVDNTYGGIGWSNVNLVIPVTNYYIYRSSDPGGPFVKVQEVSDFTHEWFPSVTGYYSVSVFFADERGEGELSNAYYWLEPAP
jgi:hypothetical protein